MDLPTINFLDPTSIRSVGAFNRCVFQFGKDKTTGFQHLYFSSILAMLFGVVFILLMAFEDTNKSDRNGVIFYAFAVFIPVHVFPIIFWIFFYFYYGACVNSSFAEIMECLNDMGNVIDSV